MPCFDDWSDYAAVWDMPVYFVQECGTWHGRGGKTYNSANHSCSDHGNFMPDFPWVCYISAQCIFISNQTVYFNLGG